MSDAAVPVVDPSGQVGTVPASQVAEMPEGSRVLSAEEYAKAQRQAALEEKHGGAVNTAIAWQNAGLSGATADLGPAAIKAGIGAINPAWGKAYGRDVLEKEEAHDILTPVGKVGGAIAGAAVGAAAGGAAGGAARLLPSAGIDALGTAVGEGIAGELGGVAARGLGGKVATQALSMGARGAVEGGLYGGLHEVGEASLGDYELSAEKILAGAKDGALFGGFAGAGLGAAGAIGGAARKSLAEVLGQRSIKDVITGQAEAQALKSFNPHMGDYQKMGRTAEQIDQRARQLGRTILDEGLASPTESLAARAEKVEARVKEVGQRIGTMVRDLDRAPVELRPNTPEILGRIQREVLDPLEAVPATPIEEAQIRAVKKYATEFADKAATPSFEELHTFRAKLDDAIFKNGKTPNPDQGIWGLKPVRQIIEDEFTKAGDLAAEKLGGKFRAEYQATKQLYSDLATVSRIGAKEASRDVALRALSLGDRTTGVAGAAAFGPKGLLLAAGSKLVRERGNSAAAVVLDKIGKLIQMADASAAVDVRIGQDIAGFLKGATARPANTNATKPARAEFGPKSAAIAALAASPAVHAKRIADATQSLADHAPKTTGAIAMTSSRGVQYLAQTMPRGRIDPTSLTPHLERPDVSDYESAEWLRRYRAIDDPLSVLDDMKRGHVSHESVEAIREAYPKLYASMQQEVTRQLVDQKHPLAYSQKVQLGILFNMPTDASMTPAFIKAVQDSFVPEPAPQGPPQGGPDAAGFAADFATVTEKAQGMGKL